MVRIDLLIIHKVNAINCASILSNLHYLFVCLFRLLMSSRATGLCRARVPRLTPDSFTRCKTETETEGGDHDFCLRRSHYIDNNPISWERVAAAGIEPRTSSSGVAHSTDWATAPPITFTIILSHLWPNNLRFEVLNLERLVFNLFRIKMRFSPILTR